MVVAQQSDTELLEQGDIFFLYRPKVEQDEPSGLSDIQRFHIVLRPRGRRRSRVLVVGRKRLPEVAGHERAWGFVDAVTSSESRIERSLRESEYQTQPRGRRRLPAARPVGEGIYAVTLRGGQMHLSYVLELPAQAGAPQHELNIGREASFALSVKNPEKGQPRGAGLQADEKADYPDRLQRAFRGRRFASEDIRLLDREGAEFVLVGARTDPEAAYGLDLLAEDEDYAQSEMVQKLRMVKSRHPMAPLLKGRWQ